MKSMQADTLFRPAFEARAALAWTVALAWLLAAGGWLGLRGPAAAAWSALLLLAAGLGALRAWQAARVWRFKLQLAGPRTAFLRVEQLVAARPRLQGQVWLGWGWQWQPSHTQRAHAIAARDAREIAPPAWWLRLAGRAPDPARGRGKAWIHGLERERSVLLPAATFVGHTGILATTGAIKTSLYKLLVLQFALQGDCVIVLDPKGDKELFAAARDAARAAGAPERFIALHPAFPATSVRFDGLRHWERETQVASRVKQMMGAGEDDSFVNFCWTVIADLVGCMRLAGRRPTVATLLRHVQCLQQPEALCEEVLAAWLAQHRPDFQQALAARLARRAPPAGGARSGTRHPPPPRLQALVDLFDELPPAQRPAPVAGLIAMLQADRQWFAKMVVAMVPTLSRIASLGPLLSPDYEDVADARPIYDMKKVVEGRKIFYVGLDALTDPAVASAVAALITCDAAGYAGEAYNHGEGTPPVVHLLVDEAGDALCEPMIQNLNKGRGAGLRIYLAMQAIADLTAALHGNAILAERVLGNLNNFIVGATQDARTLEFLEDRLGEVPVMARTQAQATGRKSEDLGFEYMASRSVAVREQPAPLVPRNLLMALPDLHYVALVNRSQVWKGRIPVLTLDDAGSTG